MEIAIVGLGYVGTVSAACFASAGHTVWGVDVNPDKVRMIEAGRSPIVEPGLDDRIAATRNSACLRVTLDLREALARAEACFVAVATPSFPSGDIDATHLLRACEQIAQALVELDRSVPVVIRSSILPTVLEQCDAKFSAVAPGRVRLCVNPEFLREGTAIQDFENPPFTLLGVEDEALENTLRSLYRSIPAPVIVLPAQAAVLVKYASNAFHALKATFANEIGALCREAGVDGQSVMATFCQDTKLNISGRYLRPGFAFGGSCLPKDVRAILYAAKRYDVDLPLMESLLPSNEAVIQRALRQIIATSYRNLGVIGLAFKSNTDDLRESPLVELAERLIGKGRDLKIYDPNVSIAHLTGANKQYIDHVIPHLSRLLVPSLDDLAGCEFLIVGHQYEGVQEFLQTAGLPFLQL
ncbi:MAG TPA: nucleotide sugar dehydrogenase [Acidobacteriaceae bacterium]|nr:nucleotide sugar dehydrogenase [Acidobacteriaceae bacterium]